MKEISITFLKLIDKHNLWLNAIVVKTDYFDYCFTLQLTSRHYQEALLK